MTGYRPGIYWQLTWRYFGPLIMAAILVSSVVFMIVKNPTYSAWNAELVILLIITRVLVALLISIYFRVLLKLRVIHHGLWALLYL